MKQERFAFKRVLYVCGVTTETKMRSAPATRHKFKQLQLSQVTQWAAARARMPV